MAILVDATNYLRYTSDPDWGNDGTIFVQVFPTWNGNNSLHHNVLFKAEQPFASKGFTFQKFSDNLLHIGFLDGVDYRMSIPATPLFTAVVWNAHLFDWSVSGSLQRYYNNNTLIDSRAGAFTVPTGTPMLSFGCIDTGGTASGGLVAYIAEFGRWNRVLSAEERRVLQVTNCPLFVPQGLQQYHRLINTSTQVINIMGPVPLTQIGTTSAGAGPPNTFYPETGAHSARPPAPEIKIVAPPVLSNAFTIYAPSVASELGLAPPVVDSSFQVFAPDVHMQEATIQEDSRELEPRNFKVRITNCVAGDDLRISRLYVDLAQGISITKAYLTIKRRAVDDTDAEAVIQKTITTAMSMSGEIVDEDTTGTSIQLYFDLSNMDTALMTPLIPYHYDVQVHTIGSAIYTCEKGVIIMQQGVTHATS